jgi:hypothetical protein
VDLPIRFPNNDDVIREDVARFRALNPLDRAREVGEMVACGERLTALSPRAAFIREFTARLKEEERQAVRAFLDRHAN